MKWGKERTWLSLSSSSKELAIEEWIHYLDRSDSKGKDNSVYTHDQPIHTHAHILRYPLLFSLVYIQRVSCHCGVLPLLKPAFVSQWLTFPIVSQWVSTRSNHRKRSKKTRWCSQLSTWAPATRGLQGPRAWARVAKDEDWFPPRHS
jgi:hypothetical protein